MSIWSRPALPFSFPSSVNKKKTSHIFVRTRLFCREQSLNEGSIICPGPNYFSDDSFSVFPPTQKYQHPMDHKLCTRSPKTLQFFTSGCEWLGEMTESLLNLFFYFNILQIMRNYTFHWWMLCRYLVIEAIGYCIWVYFTLQKICSVMSKDGKVWIFIAVQFIDFNLWPSSLYHWKPSCFFCFFFTIVPLRNTRGSQCFLFCCLFELKLSPQQRSSIKILT